MQSFLKSAANVALGIPLSNIRSDMLIGNGVIHLANAGDSPSPGCVVSAVTSHLELEQQVGGYEAQRLNRDRLEQVYVSCQKLLGAESQDEIALQGSATKAWTKVFYSIPLKQGERIVTCAQEYSANYVAMLQRSRQKGCSIEVIPNSNTGEVDVSLLTASLKRGGVAAVVISHMPHHQGTINPAEEIGKACRDYGTFFLLDAAQTVGQLVVDVQRIKCDALCATGRKFLRGPRGTGILYVRQSVMKSFLEEPSMIDHFGAPWGPDKDEYTLRRDARRYEFWESNISVSTVQQGSEWWLYGDEAANSHIICNIRLGLGVAIDYALKIGLQAIQDRISFLASAIRSALNEIEGVRLWDENRGAPLGGIVSFEIDGVHPQEVADLLRKQRVMVDVPARTLLGGIEHPRPLIVRASPHYFNLEEEVETFIKCVSEISRERKNVN